jgi:hypothetical protein
MEPEIVCARCDQDITAGQLYAQVRVRTEAPRSVAAAVDGYVFVHVQPEDCV